MHACVLYFVLTLTAKWKSQYDEVFLTSKWKVIIFPCNLLRGQHLIKQEVWSSLLFYSFGKLANFTVMHSVPCQTVTCPVSHRELVIFA